MIQRARPEAGTDEEAHMLWLNAAGGGRYTPLRARCSQIPAVLLGKVMVNCGNN